MPINTIYKQLSKLRNRHFFFLDVFAFILIPFLALALRLDLDIDFLKYLPQLFFIGLVFLIIKVFILFIFGLYKRLWHVASVDDMLKLIVIGTNAVLVQVVVFLLINKLKVLDFHLFPLSLPFIDGFFSLIYLALSRFSIRIFKRAGEKLTSKENSQRVLIIGAGQAGLMISNEIEQSENLNQEIIGFVDDDPGKIGMRIRGINVLGNREDIPKIVTVYRIQKIIIAMPSLSGREIRGIIGYCENLNVEILTVPGLYDIIDGKIDYDRLRKVQIEDLLRREPIKTDLRGLRNLISNKKVLITGGGGSIGGEVCRQIIRNNPQELFILGHGENSVFEICGELNSKHPSIKITPIIADVSDLQRLKNIFNNIEIDFVFHAAAHKHVPLMEAHPYEAIKNNVLGTKNLVEVCVEFNVQRLIMISTDKAVNPSNVMGASKRTAEMIVLNAAKKYKKDFSVVRFGNVLGSRGSVVKTFKKQIEQGGPITITHPEITRFFMTIPEAVQLVLQAFIIGNCGQVFVLDMGEPVKIINLAKDIVRLSGLNIGDDIEIIYTGLRPGEKLYEELFIKGENYSNTVNEKILISENVSNFITPGFDEKLTDLLSLIKGPNKSNAEYRESLSKVVPEFTHNESETSLTLK